MSTSVDKIIFPTPEDRKYYQELRKQYYPQYDSNYTRYNFKSQNNQRSRNKNKQRKKYF